MAKAFEDEFMDLQADYVSLCMEAMEGIADEIFIYISNEATCHMFHTFCRVNGQIKTIDQLFPPSLQRDLLLIGTEDVDKFNKLRKQYDRPAPTEIRLHYLVKNNSLDAYYKYEPVCPAESDLSQNDVLRAWILEEKKRIRLRRAKKRAPGRSGRSKRAENPIKQ